MTIASYNLQPSAFNLRFQISEPHDLCHAAEGVGVAVLRRMTQPRQ